MQTPCGITEKQQMQSAKRCNHQEIWCKKGMSPPFLALEPSDRLNGVEKQRPHRLEEGDEVG
jgi:hypothetical protein